VRMPRSAVAKRELHFGRQKRFSCSSWLLHPKSTLERRTRLDMAWVRRRSSGGTAGINSGVTTANRRFEMLQMLSFQQEWLRLEYVQQRSHFVFTFWPPVPFLQLRAKSVGFHDTTPNPNTRLLSSWNNNSTPTSSWTTAGWTSSETRQRAQRELQPLAGNSICNGFHLAAWRSSSTSSQKG
jgi:hypothetical protein